MKPSMVLTILVSLVPCISLAADQRLPRVLIIGDSVSLAYTPFLTEALKGKAVAEHNGNPDNAVAQGDLRDVRSKGEITAKTSTLEKCFLAPPESARPWVYWYWMCGNVTKKGITYDLEAMAQAGIGGAYVFSINRPNYEEYTKVEKPVLAPSELYWDMVTFAVQEAKRLGLRIAVNACDGWCVAGGPWITPELSMQRLVSSTIVVEGGKPVDARILPPRNSTKGSMWRTDAYNDYYRDIAILAYPAAAAWKDSVTETNLKAAERIADAATKSGGTGPRFAAGRQPVWTSEAQAPPQTCVPANQVLDLTGHVDATGHLDYLLPAGKWIIQRFGYATTGEMNRPAGNGAIGLECDKFNPDAACMQVERWYGEVTKRVGPELAGRTLSMHHIDSWECGSQNWSPVFRKEFTTRRGYDPAKYLPVTTGIAIGSAEESERFLWDLRRTIVDLTSDGFFKTMVASTHAQGATFSAETIAGVVTDSLQPQRDVDVPMGEFWIGSNDRGASDVPTAVSAGRIYGKHVIQAEAFTQRGMRWTEDPYFLKPLGDYTFSRGVNRFVLHVWAHQAFPERVPGVTLFNVFGTVFSGNQPWHALARPWFDYLRRCQALLQQGLPVSDVCYFIGEELPNHAIERQELSPSLPFGYDYDCINRDALLTRAAAKAGRLVLPDGMSYKLLVLPNSNRMTPEMARKIGELAQAGVAIIGPKPDRSYSLTNYPQSDDEVKRIVAESWGRVLQGAPPEEVLRRNGLPPDVEFLGVNTSWIHRGRRVQELHKSWEPQPGGGAIHRPELGMEYSSPTFASSHRRTDQADFYFVTNQELETRSVEVAFRITGKQPELWHPETGSLRDLTDWEVRSGRTCIPLRFAPAESYFIVFRRPAARAGTGTPNFPDYEQIGVITGAWTVDFQPNCGAPERIELPQLISLPDHSDSGVKHFSGIATYRKRFVLPPAAVEKKKQERIVLDLGEVKNVAVITLNGRTLPGVWKPPFRVDITDVLRPSENDIEVKVANTWKNRLLADAALPPNDRVTWTLFREGVWFNPRKDHLESAGLIGPLTILRETRPAPSGGQGKP